MKNTFKSWSDEELQIVDEMMKENYTFRDIGKTLGRTENAVRNVFRNIIYHQLLQNEPKIVAKKYHLTLEDLHESIVHPKYALREESNFPWKTLASLALVGSAYYAHLLYNNWMMLG